MQEQWKREYIRNWSVACEVLHKLITNQATFEWLKWNYVLHFVFGIQHFIVPFSGDGNRFFPPEHFHSFMRSVFNVSSLKICLFALALVLCERALFSAMPFSIQMNFIIYVGSQRFCRRILICSKMDSNCCFWSIIRLFCACLHFVLHRFFCILCALKGVQRCAW